METLTEELDRRIIAGNADIYDTLDNMGRLSDDLRACYLEKNRILRDLRAVVEQFEERKLVNVTGIAKPQNK